MPRNKHFHPYHEPFQAQNALQLQHNHINGPLSFLNPTRAYFRHPINPTQPFRIGKEESRPVATEKIDHADTQHIQNIDFQWRSRDNRKGRHTLIINKGTKPNVEYETPRSTATYRGVGQGILRMALVYPYWDISYLIATIFTLGSIVWVINSFFVFLPLPDPSSEFKDEALTAGGVTAFIGATIFEVGSVLLMLEAVNEKRSGCFGWAVRKMLKDHGVQEDHYLIKPDTDMCAHHHSNKRNLVGKGDARDPSLTQESNLVANEQENHKEPLDTPTGRSWVWFPSTYELKTHYIRELGFLACLFQFLGATIFWISGFTALPGINNVMSQGLLDGIFWVPQVVGGSGFIISGFLFMLETQRTWYTPAFGTLGWHIGFWNLIGAFGFTLCGCLGFAYGDSGALYESSLATFWGSWAFLLGSVIQWYESLDKYPVEEKYLD